MLGLIPRTFIDELLNRTDIVEFIDSHVPLKKHGTSLTACCPFHHEKTPSFNVVPKKQFYHCFGCSASGNAISFAMNYLNLSFPDAIEALATRAGMTVPREGQTNTNKPSHNLYQFLNQVTHFYEKTLKTGGREAIIYLKQRHLSGETAKKYQLGYAPVGWQTLETQFKGHKEELIASGMLVLKDDGKTYDRYRHRIMFPIHDRHGRIIGFGGRALDATQKPKYLNSPETLIFQKSRELYGLHQVIQQKDTINNILIVEGYIDVIALAEHGIVNAVATLGTATSSYHIQLLSKYTQQIIFCFDGDAAGRQAAWRALDSSLAHLNSGLDAHFVFLPEGDDPDSLVHKEGKLAFLQRINNATPLNQFLLETLTENIDLRSLAGKSQLVNAVKPYLLKIANGAYQQLLINEIARLTRIEGPRLHQLLQEKKASTAPIAPKNAQQMTRSPIRLAIAILLQHPEMYANCTPPLSHLKLDNQKHRILKTLIQQIESNPNINTALLIELWRDSPIFNALNKLAAWDHQVPTDAITTEVIDIIGFLIKKNTEQSIQQLMEKAHQQGLTDTERLSLQEKLKQRHASLIKAI